MLLGWGIDAFTKHKEKINMNKKDEALEALKELLEIVEQAIASGDWKVDGACDPDIEIYRAKKILGKNIT